MTNESGYSYGSAEYYAAERKKREEKEKMNWLRRALSEVTQPDDLVEVGVWTFLTCLGFLTVTGGIYILSQIQW